MQSEGKQQADKAHTHRSSDDLRDGVWKNRSMLLRTKYAYKNLTWSERNSRYIHETNVMSLSYANIKSYLCIDAYEIL